MDMDQFDRLSRIVGGSSSRRVALGVAAALGLGATQVDARKKKKPKNGCKGGCGTCQVCQKKGNKKTCVTAPDGTTCTGGTCRAGSCCLSSCESLGDVCGPVSDGCGGTLTCTCEAGVTPVCGNGECVTCSTACSAGCAVCATRVDGTTACGADLIASCSDTCASDADCPVEDPVCVISRTDRADGRTTNLPSFCGRTTPGVCARMNGC